MKLHPYIEEDREYLIGLRRHFHAYPEVSMEEYETAKTIEKELNKIGIRGKRVGDTGVVGILKGKKADSRITVLRGDIDALRVQDVKDKPYASRNPGVMHACGHDAHTAALIGAARYLKRREEELEGTVYFIFQQGEEYGQGARLFVKEGLLDHADRVFGIHVDSSLEAGRIAVQEGPVNASVDHFTIRIKGQGAHVSTPHKGADALYIGAQTVVTLQGIVSRLSDPLSPVVVGIGVMQAGSAYNVVAGEAVLEGTTRCFSEEIRERTNSKIREIAEGTAALYGGLAEVEFEDFASPLVNHPEACREVRRIAERIAGKENVAGRKPSLGGDDFSEYLKKAVGMYAYIGTGNPADPDTLTPQHGNRYDIDEEAVLTGANLYGDYVLYGQS